MLQFYTTTEKPRNNQKGKQIDYFSLYIWETGFALNANQYFKDVENEFFPRTFNDVTLIRLNFFIKTRKTISNLTHFSWQVLITTVLCYMKRCFILILRKT